MGIVEDIFCHYYILHIVSDEIMRWNFVKSFF